MLTRQVVSPCEVRRERARRVSIAMLVAGVAICGAVGTLVRLAVEPVDYSITRLIRDLPASCTPAPIARAAENAGATVWPVGSLDGVTVRLWDRRVPGGEYEIVGDDHTIVTIVGRDAYRPGSSLLDVPIFDGVASPP